MDGGIFLWFENFEGLPTGKEGRTKGRLMDKDLKETGKDSAF